MLDERAARLVTIIALLSVACAATPVLAQPAEVSVIGGYRFGGSVVEAAAPHRVDSDGAPAIGIVLDLPVAEGSQFEALFSHQQESVLVVPLDGFAPSTRYSTSIDHWQAGALQELEGGRRVRPFLTGMLGLTRYGVEADHAIRFTLGGGGGVKVFPRSRVGVRLDGRVFATFVDAEALAVACVQRGCVLAIHLDMAWQVEFTAGLVVRLR
jgi:hypothetical protein